MNKPFISVLMPVYNGAKYLRIAIESILNQSYRDFEFVIIDDGSKDESLRIIKSYNDPRIVLFVNPENLGLTETLNKGLGLVKGKYIARMDQDDISLPKRLETQVRFMEKHPDIGVCGCRIKVFGVGNEFVGDCPQTPLETKCYLFYNTPVAHPSVIMRTSMLRDFKLLYDANYPLADDFAFWVEAEKHFPITNIPGVLLKYRLHNTNMSFRSNKLQKETVDKIRKNKLIELGVTDPEKTKFHLDWGKQEFAFGLDFTARLDNWLQELIAINNNKHIYPEPEFSSYLAKLFFETCYQNSNNGGNAWKSFSQAYSGTFHKLKMIKMIKFFIKCFIIKRRKDLSINSGRK